MSITNGHGDDHTNGQDNSVSEEIFSIVNGNKITFSKIDIPGSYKVAGNVFPLGLSLTNSSGGAPTTEEAAAALADVSSRGIITELMNKHGALLIRGPGDSSARAFSQLVTAVEEKRGHHEYDQVGLAGSRTTLDKNVYSASEGPPSIRYHQHNEYSRYTKFPSNIHFFCQQAATKGGECPLAHSAEVFNRINAQMPDFVQTLSKKGLISPQKYRAKGKEGKNFQFSWEGPLAFGREIQPNDDMATKKAKAEKWIRVLTPHFWWLDDDELEVHQYVPGIWRHPATNNPVWFNSLNGMYATAKDHGATEPPHIGDDGLTYSIQTFADGSEIPKEWMENLYSITTELEVPLKPQPGDLILVDNYQVSHGRYPWTEGDRTVLVSMWDTANEKERIKPF